MMPSPGAYAMVLDSTFSTERRACRFSWILIDGGSIINILYRDTMEKLGIKEKQLLPSRTVFMASSPGFPALQSARSRLMSCSAQGLQR